MWSAVIAIWDKLVRFDTGQPGEAIVGTITGLLAGEAIVSIDFRPLTGRLYGVSRNRVFMGCERCHRGFGYGCSGHAAALTRPPHYGADRLGT
jgi:hypothetical protein